ncbi:DUF554 family protein [Cyanobium sp. CH-040]|uniref:DUF554 family protein n=1 Tax=Cyanobium sp. CH-040 TaxID=2823708 RepID=UPI0020CF9D6B|nr:DUF554 family protein [Cyanobium sp. CH-040]MCP9927810.1 DUF554 family protein [Cyanobium sp. CH-040]
MALWEATSGTWINLLAVALGTAVGAALGSRISLDLAQQWRRWLGVVTLLLAVQMVQPLWQLRLGAFPAVLPALLALVLGVSAGEALALERRLGAWLRAGGSAVAGSGPGILAGTFVLFCVGPMTLVGCLRNGALGDADLLLVKAALDGVSSALLAAGVGLTLAWVLLPMAVFQFALSAAGALMAAGLSDPMASPVLVFSAALGGLLVLSLALELLELPHPSSVNALPALLLAPLLGWGIQP